MSTPEPGLRSYIQPLDSPLTPQLEFSVISVEILPFQVVPTLVFSLNATESNGLEVFGFNVAGNNTPTYSWVVNSYQTATEIPNPRYDQTMYVSGTNTALSAR